jgi:hypothetical protein
MVVAMDRAQEVETDLSSHELAGLMEVFEDRDRARAYLAIKNDDVRKAWIERKLASTSGRSA